MALFGPEYLLNQPMSVVIKENPIHLGSVGEGVKVTDTNGTLLFKSKDSRMLRDKEVLLSAQGPAVGTLQKKMISLHGTWNVYRGGSTSDSDLVATIEPKLLNVMGKTVRIIRAGESEPFLTIKGNWRDKAFTYTDPNGAVVAETVRKGRFSGLVNFVTGDDSYILTVQPGYDLAFLVAVTIALNDIINPGQSD